MKYLILVILAVLSTAAVWQIATAPSQNPHHLRITLVDEKNGLEAYRWVTVWDDGTISNGPLSGWYNPATNGLAMQVTKDTNILATGKPIADSGCSEIYLNGKLWGAGCPIWAEDGTVIYAPEAFAHMLNTNGEKVVTASAAALHVTWTNSP